MKDVLSGSATLLPAASEIRREAAEQAAPAARAAADRITQWFRRHPTGPQARAASHLVRQAEVDREVDGEGDGEVDEVDAALAPEPAPVAEPTDA